MKHPECRRTKAADSVETFAPSAKLYSQQAAKEMGQGHRNSGAIMRKSSWRRRPNVRKKEPSPDVWPFTTSSVCLVSVQTLLS